MQADPARDDKLPSDQDLQGEQTNSDFRKRNSIVIGGKRDGIRL
jgi:hypothetical protein